MATWKPGFVHSCLRQYIKNGKNTREYGIETDTEGSRRDVTEVISQHSPRRTKQVTKKRSQVV
jgi:hypothetical protein